MFGLNVFSFCLVAEVGPSHKINDELMRFFDQCQKFVEDVENNQTALEEVHLFKASAEMKRVQMKMADQLQVPYDRITPGCLVPNLCHFV